MACSVGIPLAYSSESSFLWRYLGREYVSIHWRVRLAAPPGCERIRSRINQIFVAIWIPARAQRWLRPAGWAVAILFPSRQKAHRSVYNTSKALYSSALG